MKKSTISPGTYFITACKIWGSAWLGLLFSILPMYVHRGLNKNNDAREALVETIILWSVGLLAASVILFFLIGRSDEIERWTRKNTCKLAAGAVGIYVFVWMFYWLFSANNLCISTTGFYLSTMIGKTEDGFPNFAGAFFGALIYGIFYAGAIILGGELARHRRKKRQAEIISS